MLLGFLITLLVPSGATIVFGADDTVQRRSGRKITASGGDRAAVRASKKHGIRCFGLQWVSMLRLVAVPWSRRVGAVPCLPAWCAPAETATRRRHKTGVDWVRHLLQHVRRGLPGRRLVVVVAGGFAAVSLALAGVKHHVTMGSRLRWEAALQHPPAPPPQGNRGPTPWTGQRQRRLQEWAERTDPPWETVAVAWYRGQRQTLWVFSRTALWQTPRWSPVRIRDVLVGEPEGKLRLAALFAPDLEASSAQLLPWVVRRWSVAVTVAESRAHLGLETQRQWSSQAIAHTTPVRLGLFSRVTVLAWRLSQAGDLPVQQTAWYRQVEPTFADGLALVRQHRWRARYVVHSTPEAESRQFPPEAFDLLINGIPLAA